MEMAVMKIRLDKYLSDTNCGTRSEVKKMIRQGLVCVDQKIIKSPEYKVDTEIQNISVLFRRQLTHWKRSVDCI